MLATDRRRLVVAGKERETVLRQLLLDPDREKALAAHLAWPELRVDAADAGILLEKLKPPFQLLDVHGAGRRSLQALPQVARAEVLRALHRDRGQRALDHPDLDHAVTHRLVGNARARADIAVRNIVFGDRVARLDQLLRRDLASGIGRGKPRQLGVRKHGVPDDPELFHEDVGAGREMVLGLGRRSRNGRKLERGTASASNSGVGCSSEGRSGSSGANSFSSRG